MAFSAMQQRTIDFDSLAQPEPAHVAETASLPPPETETAPPPLVRPDRQLTYGGVSHQEWPLPEHDPDTITVDRIQEDIDGPPHRFVISRGDTVEALLGPSRVDIGEVTAVNQRKGEVCVSFGNEPEAEWVEATRVYPAPDDLPLRPRNVVLPDESCRGENLDESKPLGSVSSNGATSVYAPYSFEEYKTFRRDFAAGTLPYSEYQEQFTRLCASRNAILNELTTRFKATELAVIASRMGSFGAKRSTKAENAESIYRRMLSSFLLDGTVSYSMRERYEDAVKLKVEGVTQDLYGQSLADRKAKACEHEKAITNPESFFEFRTFLQTKTETDLTDEQLARYDALHADMTRERRAAETKTTVEQFESKELQSCEFQIKAGYHDRRQCLVWIVQLSQRVERSTFDELNRKSKMLGGWYSSFKKADSGFHFLEKDKAERFAALLASDANRTDILEARKERRAQTAAERLHELAADLAARAEETVERSENSRQNTARRADIQAGMRGRAFADQALARTMHSIAEALSRGEAKYLGGIRFKTQVETLESVLYLAKWARIRAIRKQTAESHVGHGRRLDDEEARPISEADIRYAEYPYPSIYKPHLAQVVRDCASLRGAKQLAQKMAKRLARETDEFVTFKEPYDVELLSQLAARAASSILVDRLELALEKHRRLQRANITDIHELRSALREYLAHRAEARGDDPVKVAERELLGIKLPGFFPTPRPVIERMLDLAELAPGHKVLEPSCGKGDIVDCLKDEHPEALIHAIELNRTLADVLGAKGHEVEFSDFLSHATAYDRIVMNPPFENGADALHVQHAYSLLRPGGRLVAVMSEGPFFRSDSKSTAFREWFSDVGGESEPLPDDAFRGAEAFRETRVRTRLVIINKGGT